MMTIDQDRDFISIGQLAAHLQQSVRAIERAANKLGLKPALRLNMIPHFSGDQVEKLTKELRKE